MRRPLPLLVLALALAIPAGVSAQTFKYCAFGDSITCGKRDGNKCPTKTVDPLSDAGYPGRLRDSLDCTGESTSCQVYNYGKGGEETLQAVTRIDTVLAEQNFDVVLLMEGTNDVCCTNRSNAAIRDNLQIIQTKAASAGVDTVYASIIQFHPDNAEWGTQEPRVKNLRNAINSLATDDGRWFADPWSELCGVDNPDPSNPGPCFNNDYAYPNDNGLHPDPSGYDRLADEFLAGLQQHLVPLKPNLVSPTDGAVTNLRTVKWDMSANATWYQIEWDNGAERKWLDANAFCQSQPCTYTPPSLTEDTHIWRLRARNPKGRSGWSAKRSFTYTTDPPVTPTPISPTEDTFDRTPLFRWSHVFGADEYVIQIDSETAQTKDAATHCSGSVCEWAPTNNRSLGTHTWRVRSKNVNGMSAYSNPKDFEILACSPENLTLQTGASGSTTEQACHVITAQGTYHVGSNDDLTLHAGDKIVFRDNFRVEPGGTLHCRVDP